jgi:hypothetical protein
MVMDYCNRYTPPLIALIDGVAARGGFGPSGWIHDVVIRTAREYNFDAYRKEHDSIEEGIKEIMEFLIKKTPVIISAVKNFSEADKFHMVVLVGFKKEEDELDGFYYHDPDSQNREEGKNKLVPIEIFKKHWRKMSIYVKEPEINFSSPLFHRR